MKEFTIRYNDSNTKWWVRDDTGHRAQFLGTHLIDIVTEELYEKRHTFADVTSESHMIAVLESLGVTINLLELDGSAIVW